MEVDSGIKEKKEEMAVEEEKGKEKEKESVEEGEKEDFNDDEYEIAKKVLRVLSADVPRLRYQQHNHYHNQNNQWKMAYLNTNFKIISNHLTSFFVDNPNTKNSESWECVFCKDLRTKFFWDKTLRNFTRIKFKENKERVD